MTCILRQKSASKMTVRIYLISHFLYLLYFSLSHLSTAPKKENGDRKKCGFYNVHFDVTTRDIISKFINKSD